MKSFHLFLIEKTTVFYPSYAARALDRTDVTIPMSDLENEETSEQLEKWQNVVILYSLRLLLAPLVESAVLLDRLLFVLEQGKGF